MSNSLNPDQVRHFDRPDLGPNCLQKLPADNISRQRVKVGMVFQKVNCVQVKQNSMRDVAFSINSHKIYRIDFFSHFFGFSTVTLEIFARVLFSRKFEDVFCFGIMLYLKLWACRDGLLT